MYYINTKRLYIADSSENYEIFRKILRKFIS